ncbi:MAG: hypothetical protein CMD72_03405 [Gammaproteobacteria bacterium]|nr:hypothetical protein [Gammaproteobacteria bacterium]
MNFIIRALFFFIGIFVKMFSYTILMFIFIIFVLVALIYINFGNDITFIIEKFHETIPQAISI